MGINAYGVLFTCLFILLDVYKRQLFTWQEKMYLLYHIKRPEPEADVVVSCNDIHINVRAVNTVSRRSNEPQVTNTSHVANGRVLQSGRHSGI